MNMLKVHYDVYGRLLEEFNDLNTVKFNLMSKCTAIPIVTT